MSCTITCTLIISSCHKFSAGFMAAKPRKFCKHRLAWHEACMVFAMPTHRHFRSKPRQPGRLLRAEAYHAFEAMQAAS